MRTTSSQLSWSAAKSPFLQLCKSQLSPHFTQGRLPVSDHLALIFSLGLTVPPAPQNASRSRESGLDLNHLGHLVSSATSESSTKTRSTLVSARSVCSALLSRRRIDKLGSRGPLPCLLSLVSKLNHPDDDEERYCPRGAYKIDVSTELEVHRG